MPDRTLEALLIAAICALQIVWIGTAVWQFVQRRKAEIKVRHQQAELAHASRLGMAGELTAFIVHEVNQPIGAILSNADAALLLLKRPNPPLDQIQDILIDIRADDLRASDVICQLRALLRKRDIVLAPLSLNDLVADSARIVGNMAIRHAVSFQTQLARDLPDTQGDRTHLQQVLINLALNAMEAMADRPPAERQLIVRTHGCIDGMATIEVHDRGPGVPRAIRDRLFEPYFTTKPEGLGMGLAIARNIVAAHGGQLDFHCPPAGGTVFRLHLPVRALQSTHLTNPAPAWTPIEEPS